MISRGYFNSFFASSTRPPTGGSLMLEFYLRKINSLPQARDKKWFHKDFRTGKINSYWLSV